jgi:hypothetical protein
MSSGETGTPRPKTRKEEAQRSLEGLLEGEQADDDEPAAVEPPAAKRARRASKRTRAVSSDGDDRLRASLDALEESVKLLVARYGEAVEARATAEARSRKGAALDPVALLDHVEELETEVERLERHAAFLEDRIRGLLARVRYVIES